MRLAMHCACASRVAEARPSGRNEMADVALILLTVASFVVFALILKGSERL